MRTKTIIDPDTGKREDRTDYPITAVREALLNALVHRDYSIHTEGMPIQLVLYEDRMELNNPGGLYGRIKIDQLGKVQPDTRNPVLATALELLGITENRYSGIPTIRRELNRYGLPEPVFSDKRGQFSVEFYKAGALADTKGDPGEKLSNMAEQLIAFCRTPRTRQEIADYLGMKSVSYAVNTYVMPLVRTGKIKLALPNIPQSPKQKYYSS